MIQIPGKELSEPPEAALAGENVPTENQRDELTETMIQDAMSTLKKRGPTYRAMCESELREKAIETLRHAGVDL